MGRAEAVDVGDFVFEAVDIADCVFSLRWDVLATSTDKSSCISTEGFESGDHVLGEEGRYQVYG